jgi:hypothetical protein
MRNKSMISLLILTKTISNFSKISMQLSSRTQLFMKTLTKPQKLTALAIKDLSIALASTNPKILKQPTSPKDQVFTVSTQNISTTKYKYIPCFKLKLI